MKKMVLLCDQVHSAAPSWLWDTPFPYLSNGKAGLKRIQNKDTRVTKTWKAAMEWLINKPNGSWGIFSHKKRQQGQEYEKSFKSQKAQKAWPENSLFSITWELKAIKSDYNLKRCKMDNSKYRNYGIYFLKIICMSKIHIASKCKHTDSYMA